VWLEEIVPCGELEGHAGCGPDVCRGSVARPQQNLQRSLTLKVKINYFLLSRYIQQLPVSIKSNMLFSFYSSNVKSNNWFLDHFLATIMKN
jgi:hypothetical protein